MNSAAAAWLVIVLTAVLANLPFANDRILAVGPTLRRKSLGWRAAELLVTCALALGAGLALEARIGQIQPQRWEFYAAFGFLFVTLAFPGFVWRYLRRNS